MLLLCVCVFINLHITAQSGHVILVVLCHSHYPPKGLCLRIRVCVCVCVCMCVYVSTKLHITAQSGPVILVILCYLH